MGLKHHLLFSDWIELQANHIDIRYHYVCEQVKNGTITKKADEQVENRTIKDD